MARDVLSTGLADIFLAGNAEQLPSATVRTFSQTWLDAKQIEIEPSSHQRYVGVIERFLKFLGTKADRDASTVTAAEITRFRDAQARELSISSAQLALKVLRALFQTALRQDLVSKNQAAMVDKLKIRGESKRRPFTMAEIKKLLEKAKGTEWEGMILFGIYSGQRLGDLAGLTWRAVNLEKRELSFVTKKTGRRMILPLARPLADYIETLPSSDDPGGFLFPKLAVAAQKRVGTLSNWFHDLLVEAGLAVERKHQGEKRGRDTARAVSEISFHSLRHSATTFLKAAGVSDALAREIIGHDSEVVSRRYTHLSTEDLRGAIEKLPDITRATSEEKK
ncbi:MAG: site-specific integrase [Verrucomicrobia bacterium]|nr:site-specific integrase [Verrucomicrobiota bacterium]